MNRGGIPPCETRSLIEGLFSSFHGVKIESKHRTLEKSGGKLFESIKNVCESVRGEIQLQKIVLSGLSLLKTKFLVLIFHLSVC